jgi:hypothetical protein
VAHAKKRDQAEHILAAAIRRQRTAMTRKGVASDKVERECAWLESAVRTRVWLILLSPNPKDAA